MRKDVAPDGRMLTAVVPLRSPEERAAEVAAMLGLDAAAAGAMLRDAAAQDAAPPCRTATGAMPRDAAAEGPMGHGHAAGGAEAGGRVAQAM